MPSFSGTTKTISFRKRRRNFIKVGLNLHYDPSNISSYSGSGTAVNCLNNSNVSMFIGSKIAHNRLRGFFQSFSTGSVTEDLLRKIIIPTHNSTQAHNQHLSKYLNGVGISIWFKAEYSLGVKKIGLIQNIIDVFTNSDGTLRVDFTYGYREYAKIFSRPNAVHKSKQFSATINTRPFDWHHLVVSYDSALRQAKIYIDRQLIAQDSFVPSSYFPGTLRDWYWSGRCLILYSPSYVRDVYFEGRVGCVRIYTTSMSQNLVDEIFNAEKNIYFGKSVTYEIIKSGLIFNTSGNLLNDTVYGKTGVVKGQVISDNLASSFSDSPDPFDRNFTNCVLYSSGNFGKYSIAFTGNKNSNVRFSGSRYPSGNQSHTIEFFILLPNHMSDSSCVICGHDVLDSVSIRLNRVSTTQNYFVWLSKPYKGGSGMLDRFFISKKGVYLIKSSNFLSVNVWYHVAFCYDDQTKIWSIFIDGNLNFRSQPITDQNYDISNSFFIGSLNGALFTRGFPGLISNFRIDNQILYTENFGKINVPLVSNYSTNVLTGLSGFIEDFSSNPTNIVSTEASISTNSPFGAHSTEENGLYELNNQNTITISAWVKENPSSKSYVICSNFFIDPTTKYTSGFVLYSLKYNNVNKICLRLGRPNTSTDLIGEVYDITLPSFLQWFNIVAIYERNVSMRFYFNGERDYQTAFENFRRDKYDQSVAVKLISGVPMSIGRSISTTVQTGRRPGNTMDDLRVFGLGNSINIAKLSIYNRVLTDDEVWTNFNADRATFLT
jgi:hypothetical protein